MKMKIIAAMAFVGFGIIGCTPIPQPTANDTQREQQSSINNEGAHEVGMPAIKNFRDMRGLKYWYERRDQANLLTYSYTKNLEGRWVYFCDSIGYPIPGGTQYSAPQAMQRYSVRDSRYSETSINGWNWGVAALPQAEPNGIYPPSTAEGTGIICINPNNNKAEAVYAEDKVDTFTWPQRGAIGEPDRSSPKPPPPDPLVK
jgi:hypothetical protein